MSSLKFIHAADLHLDSPFVGLQQVNEELAQRLRSATFDAFDNLIKVAIEHKVDFLLVAGDVYDSADGGLRAQLRFRDGLLKLAQEGIPSYVVHGNHDPLDRWISSLDWPDKVTIFSKDDHQSHSFHRGDLPLARIHGISYPTKVPPESFGRRFRRTGPEAFQIGLLHCNVNGNPHHDDYAPRTLAQLRECELDYWALGHVHERQIVNQTSPFVAYPGNIQGRHLRELGARGALLVHTRDSLVADHKFLPLDAVRWDHKSIRIEGLTTVDGLLARIHESLETEGRSLIVRITLKGRGPLHRELAKNSHGILSEVRAACSGSQSQQFIWVDRLDIQTRPEVDLRERSKEDDFVGSLLRVADGLQRQNLVTPLQALWSNTRVGGLLPEFNDSELAEILQRAMSLAAEPLMEEE